MKKHIQVFTFNSLSNQTTFISKIISKLCTVKLWRIFTKRKRFLSKIQSSYLDVFRWTTCTHNNWLSLKQSRKPSSYKVRVGMIDFSNHLTVSIIRSILKNVIGIGLIFSIFPSFCKNSSNHTNPYYKALLLAHISLLWRHNEREFHKSFAESIFKSSLKFSGFEDLRIC